MSPVWRLVSGVLVGVAGASALLILAVAYFATDPPVTPQILFELVLIQILVPATAAWLLRRAARARVEIDGNGVAIDRRDLRMEVPIDAVAGISPWVIPLPGSGASIRLRSGRRLRYGFQTQQIADLVAALFAAGVDVGAAMRHPAMVYAAAKAGRRWRWYHAVGKFAVFGLLPTGIFFNAHQYIAYGGTFGEYYLLGLRSYLTTFAVYFATICVYLALYASLWRAIAEGVALAAAWLRADSADGVRRIVEIGCAVLYYGGVPALVALRFLA